MAESKRKRKPPKLDQIDMQILQELQRSSKITNATLSERVGISPPSTLERVRKLENQGVITGYVALLDNEVLNKSIVALVHVSLSMHSSETLANAKAAFAELEEVLCCWYTAGDEDFVLQVMVSDMSEYETFVSERLSAVPHIGTIRTAFVLNTVKQTTQIPLNGITEEQSGNRRSAGAARRTGTADSAK